jgi:hypothetical protein
MIVDDQLIVLGGICGGFLRFTLDKTRTYVLFYSSLLPSLDCLRSIAGGVLMSAESLSLVAGTVLSLAFSYIPGVRSWFIGFDPASKRLIMLALLAITAGGVYGLSCLGWGFAWGITLSCDQSGLLGLIEQFVIAIIANQSIFAISPHKKDTSRTDNPGCSDLAHT